MKNLFAWLQLVRFPNVFTILADFLTVSFFTFFLLKEFPSSSWTAFGLAGVGSVFLYWGGMILNDVFDLKEDSILRPKRPLPSGRISEKTARKTGCLLLTGGFLLTSIPAMFTPAGFLPAAVSALLLLCILLYDAKLKNTPLGPYLMGFCRGLNLLVFFAFWPPNTLFSSPLLLYPIALTIFITGVTFYARCETEDAPEAGIQRPNPGMMLFSVLFLAGGLAMLVRFPAQMRAWNPESIIPLFQAQEWRWLILFTFLALFLSFRAVTAYFSGPYRTRQVVKQALFTVFLIDAALTLLVGGLPCALVILSLFLMAILSGKWLYST
ncbi:MAG: hypothetical protein E7028_00335 [Planctomycetaceae bacterium]|nr:hypothetical protein [Planctomycetaceae bacterium]